MAVRDVAFTRFALSRLVAIIHPEHIASRRVAENIGMHDEKTTVIEDYPAVIYAIGRATSASEKRLYRRGLAARSRFWI